jgi:FMN phosphatase YigB (HAD superfamily)
LYVNDHNVLDKIKLLGFDTKMFIYKTLLIDAIGCLINPDFTINLELLQYFGSRNETLVLVTNAKDENLLKIKDLLAAEKIRIFTKEFNPIKTDPKYFEILLSELNLKSEDCFYVDHDKANLESAEANSIKGVLFKDNSDVILELKTILN